MTAAPELARGALAEATIHEQWVAAYRTPEAQGFYEMAFDEIAGRLGAPPGSVVLDAGCGSCAKSILLASRGFIVVGTDFSGNALELAAEAVRTRGLAERITLRQGDLLSLPFGDGEFRYILCWGVLMHVPELERAVKELARVLAPGGVLVVSEGNMYSAQSFILRALKRFLGRSRSEVIRTPIGLESHERTAQGLLVTRQTDMPAFIAHCEGVGLGVKGRIAGQLTELYTLAPWRWMRRMIHGINAFWFRFVRLPGPAFGNIVMFEKRASRDR
jgi:SAM-dependent methyltransferase